MNRADLIEMYRRRIDSLARYIRRESLRLSEMQAELERYERELTKLTNEGESDN